MSRSGLTCVEVRGLMFGVCSRGVHEVKNLEEEYNGDVIDTSG